MPRSFLNVRTTEELVNLRWFIGETDGCRMKSLVIFPFFDTRVSSEPSFGLDVPFTEWSVLFVFYRIGLLLDMFSGHVMVDEKFTSRQREVSVVFLVCLGQWCVKGHVHLGRVDPGPELEHFRLFEFYPLLLSISHLSCWYRSVFDMNVFFKGYWVSALDYGRMEVGSLVNIKIGLDHPGIYLFCKRIMVLI